MEKTLNVVFCLKGYLCTWTIYSSIRSDFIALGFSFILFPAFTSCCCHSENPSGMPSEYVFQRNDPTGTHPRFFAANRRY